MKLAVLPRPNGRLAIKLQDSSLTHRSSCVYHPAPLTKTRASSSETGEHLPSLPASSNRASPYPTRIQQSAAPISPSSLQEEITAPTLPTQQPSPMLPMTLGTAHGRQMSSTISHKSPDNFTSSFRNNGFLGPTAYSAVFTENSGKQIFFLLVAWISLDRLLVFLHHRALRSNVVLRYAATSQMTSY
jgi:hypothetical protein